MILVELMARKLDLVQALVKYWVGNTQKKDGWRFGGRVLAPLYIFNGSIGSQLDQLMSQYSRTRNRRVWSRSFRNGDNCRRKTASGFLDRKSTRLNSSHVAISY